MQKNGMTLRCVKVVAGRGCAAASTWGNFTMVNNNISEDEPQMDDDYHLPQGKYVRKCNEST